jgi:predicted LPLAT superfamily acyltransferase
MFNLAGIVASFYREQILSFLNEIREGGKQQSKHDRYCHLKVFFNFIMSKEILLHSNLSTTQLYLGKINDSEATRRVEHLYG